MPTPTKPDKGSTAVAERPAQLITKLIESRAAQLAEVMPDGMDSNRFLRATLTAITRNPKLLDCTPESLILAVYDAAEVGLVPTGLLNRAWIVPQRHNTAPKGQPPRWITEAELRIGYQGLADLARSEDVTKIESRAVYDGDRLVVEYGTNPRIEHTPTFNLDTTQDDLTYVYAVATLRNGDNLFEVMTRSQIDSIRARAPGANVGPWSTDFVQMARKTVIRRLCNYLPLTPRAQSAIAKDDERELRPLAPRTTRTEEVKGLLETGTSAPQAEVTVHNGHEITVDVEEAEENEISEEELDEIADAAFGPKDGD